MFCRKCGRTLRNDERICSNCGQVIEELTDFSEFWFAKTAALERLAESKTISQNLSEHGSLESEKNIQDLQNMKRVIGQNNKIIRKFQRFLIGGVVFGLLVLAGGTALFITNGNLNKQIRKLEEQCNTLASQTVTEDQMINYQNECDSIKQNVANLEKRVDALKEKIQNQAMSEKNVKDEISIRAIPGVGVLGGGGYEE